MMRFFILLCALVASVNAATYPTDSDPTAAEVQTLVDGAADGDTITIASGTHTWTTGVTISGKGITISGAGGGKLAGNSKTSLAIGTGTKVFTIHTGTNGASTVLSSALYGFTPGETIRAIYKADGTKYMEGTVTSYVGTTLTLDITTTGGSGTYAAWTFFQEGQTILRWDSSGNTMFTVTEDATHSTTIENLDMRGLSSTPTRLIYVAGSGKPFIWRDGLVNNASDTRIITIESNKGLLYNLGWHTGWRFAAASSGIPGYGLVVKNDSDGQSWMDTSIMGDDDTTGVGNVYVEDCFFAGLNTETFDADGGARLAVRRCVFDNSGGTSHGADTGPVGMRHLQLVENLVVFENLGVDTAPMDYAFFIRGGTGIVANNVIPDINSGEWGNKAEFKLQVQNLQRNAGPHPLWGDNISGAQYPAPRQVGFGRVTGNGNSQFSTPPHLDGEGLYTGDAEPWYQWGNSGSGNYASPSLENYATPTGNQDTVADYIQVGRDWLNETKSGWTSYTYPHPLRGVSESVRNPGRRAKAGRVLTR